MWPGGSQLNRIGDILYEECRGKFGEITKRRGVVPRQKGRREREVKQLVKRWHQLQKQWRKAVQEEKQGLKSLWEEVKKNLVVIRQKATTTERLHGRHHYQAPDSSMYSKTAEQD